MDKRQAQADGEYITQSAGDEIRQKNYDLIQRQAVLEAIDVKAWEFCDYLISKNRNDEQKPVSHFADNLRECVREELPSVKQEPSGDLISRQALLDAFGFSEKTRKWGGDHSGYNTMMLYEIQDVIESQPPVKPQEPYDFAKWVASEIFDNMWEYNQDSFAEIACRKLVKLGIVRAKGDEWELVDPQERSYKE